MAETKDKLRKVIKSFLKTTKKLDKADKGLNRNATSKTPVFKYRPEQKE